MQPKFVPNEAVDVKFENSTSAKVRLVDCVGYPIVGAEGFFDGENPRMVKTPWNEQEIPFEEAAEIGTKKVIELHSTIAVVVTTDGSIAGIPRKNYIEAEERVVSELKQAGKPFIVLLNSTTPDSENAKTLALELEEKYEVKVQCSDVSKLNAENIEQIIQNILFEFPVSEIKFSLPRWIRSLSYSDELVLSFMNAIKDKTAAV
jgi:stage IV sporulation protein A